jgi:hypothetical protein
VKWWKMGAREHDCGKTERKKLRVVRREELVVERNRKEGSARYAKLLKQVNTNRS